MEVENRILNISVLVAAGSRLPIPVSCVEEGRWHSRSAGFEAAPQAAQRLRRRKAEAVRAAPLARGVAQADVWDEVALTADRLAVASSTRANADAFRAHRPSLAQLEREFPLQPGQCGAVLAVGNDLCLDAVSRPDAFGHLWPKLRLGYLLDALDRLDRTGADPVATTRFITELSNATATRGPSAGRGDDVRLSADTILGSGLELDGELLQLCPFTRDSGAGPRAGRITGRATGGSREGRRQINDDRSGAAASPSVDFDLGALWEQVRRCLDSQDSQALGAVRVGLTDKQEKPWAQTNDGEDRVNLTLELKPEQLELNLVGWKEAQSDALKDWLQSVPGEKAVNALEGYDVIAFARRAYKKTPTKRHSQCVTHVGNDLAREFSALTASLSFSSRFSTARWSSA
jgi:hypothetical protein